MTTSCMDRQQEKLEGVLGRAGHDQYLVPGGHELGKLFLYPLLVTDYIHCLHRIPVRIKIYLNVTFVISVHTMNVRFVISAYNVNVRFVFYVHINVRFVSSVYNVNVGFVISVHNVNVGFGGLCERSFIRIFDVSHTYV